MDLTKMMLEHTIWAVVGATDNPEKFGNKIYKKLKRFGYEVYAVNPMYQYVDGDRCYASLSEIPKAVDCVDIVVYPDRSKLVLEEVQSLGIKNVWFQPGTFTPDIIDAAETAGLNVVYHHCVLVELDRK